MIVVKLRAQVAQGSRYNFESNIEQRGLFEKYV